VIARAIRLLLASGFLAAVAHVAPVAERAALGITRVEDLAPEAIARPLGEVRAAVRLSHRIESLSAPGTLPNLALTPGAIRTADPADVCGDRGTRQYRHWSRDRDDRILAEYGLPPKPEGRKKLKKDSPSLIPRAQETREPNPIPEEVREYVAIEQ
jgi:hypothetical protein